MLFNCLIVHKFRASQLSAERRSYSCLWYPPLRLVGVFPRHSTISCSLDSARSTLAKLNASAHSPQATRQLSNLNSKSLFDKGRPGIPYASPQNRFNCRSSENETFSRALSGYFSRISLVDRSRAAVANTFSTNSSFSLNIIVSGSRSSNITFSCRAAQASA